MNGYSQLAAVVEVVAVVVRFSGVVDVEVELEEVLDWVEVVEGSEFEVVLTSDEVVLVVEVLLTSDEVVLVVEVVLTSEDVVLASDELELVEVLDGISEVLEEVLGVGSGAGFFLYRISLEPAPQYSYGFPAHSILHWLKSVRTDPTPSALPHQHSLLYTPSLSQHLRRKYTSIQEWYKPVFNPKVLVCAAYRLAFIDIHVIGSGEERQRPPCRCLCVAALETIIGIPGVKYRTSGCRSWRWGRGRRGRRGRRRWGRSGI